MRESNIKNAVKKFFEREGLFVPETEFNVGIRPDVTGFKWLNSYSIDCRAVECKVAKVPRWLLTPDILNRLRKLQRFFPQVYLASPVPKKNEDVEAVQMTLRQWKVGYIPVDQNLVVKEKILDPKTSPNLDRYDCLLHVRQRLALVLTYINVFNPPKEDLEIRIGDPGIVWCFVKEAANYTAGNGFIDGDYHLGVCVEQKENVRKTLNKIDPKELFQVLIDLPENYLIKYEYIDTYRPREVSQIFLHKKTSGLTGEEVKYVAGTLCKELKYKVRFHVHRKIWAKHEVLSKEEHQRRMEQAKGELEPLRKLLRSEL
jgi:hypothetical protein